MVAETNILKYSAAMNIGYTQSSNKYYHVLKIRPVLVQHELYCQIDVEVQEREFHSRKFLRENKYKLNLYHKKTPLN